MKIYKYIIVLSFLGLWLNTIIPSNILYITGLALILTFGIMHGANDIVIIQKSFKSHIDSNIYKLVLIYLTIVGLFAFFFVFITDIALLVFILISAYHFGEQHWQLILKSTNPYLKIIFELLYGSLIFTLIFYFHQQEVEVIIENICGHYYHLDFLDVLLAVLCLLVVVFSFYFNKTNRLFRLQLTEQLLYILVLAIIFRVTDLIWSFAIYFVLWHSVPSLRDQLQYIYGRTDKQSVFKYVKQAVWYWLVSVVGLFGLYWLLKDTKVFEALLFSFIAAITFPHVLVISKMFKTKKD